MRPPGPAIKVMSDALRCAWLGDFCRGGLHWCLAASAQMGRRRQGLGERACAPRAALRTPRHPRVPLLLLQGAGGDRGRRTTRQYGTQGSMAPRGGQSTPKGKGDAADPTVPLLGHHSGQALNKRSGQGSRSMCQNPVWWNAANPPCKPPPKHCGGVWRLQVHGMRLQVTRQQPVEKQQQMKTRTDYVVQVTAVRGALTQRVR